MANLVQNSSGLYSIRFRLGTQRFNRSLETTSEKEAKEEKARIEKTIRLVMEGEKDLPDNATPEQVWVFLRSGGKRIDKVKLAAAVSLEKVTEARDRGLPAFAETCPQYLLLSIDDLARPGFEGAKYVFTPPLRPKEHQPKLWDGLKHDHLQVVSTDHCPFCFADQKILGKDDFTKIPNGGPGIENRLHLIYHHGVNAGKISLNRFVEITSTTPARIFGMYPRKGEIAPGSDADVVIWDPEAVHTLSAKTHHMRVDYSMFEGFEIRGNARTVISRGEVIVDNGQFFGKPGRGQYLKRAARGGAWK